MRLGRMIDAVLLQKSLYEDHSFGFIVLCLFETKNPLLDTFFSWKYEKQNHTSSLRLIATWF